MAIRRWAVSFRNFLNHPGRVAVLCLVFLMVTLLLNGLLWKLWSLHRDYERLTADIKGAEANIKKLSLQLKQAKEPSFIERQARDKLDLARDSDLVFVFADQ